LGTERIETSWNSSSDWLFFISFVSNDEVMFDFFTRMGLLLFEKGAFEERGVREGGEKEKTLQP